MLSRVANSLYWMSRYLERAEHTARVVDVNLSLMLEGAPATARHRWQRVLRATATPTPDGEVDAYQVTQLLTFDRVNRNSIVSCIATARDNARQVREQIGAELWEQLNRLSLEVRQTNMAQVWNGQPHDFFQSVRDSLHLLLGVTDSTMSHDEGWYFMQVGRYIERAQTKATSLDVHFSELLGDKERQVDTDSYLDWVLVLESCTAFEAYCKARSADLKPEKIAEFLLLDPDFPHSLRMSIDMLQTALQSISELTDPDRARRLERLGGRLSSTVKFGQIDEIMHDGMHSYLRYIQHQCDQIHTGLRQIYFAYLVEEEVAS